MYYQEYKTLNGDLHELAKCYADYLNALEHCDSVENERRYSDEFLVQVSDILDGHVFAIDPDLI